MTVAEHIADAVVALVNGDRPALNASLASALKATAPEGIDPTRWHFQQLRAALNRKGARVAPQGGER